MLVLDPRDRRGSSSGRWSRSRARSTGRLATALLAALWLTACAASGRPSPAAAPAGSPPPFRIGRDTFAFANLVGAEWPASPEAFTNYCIVMVRAATQFFRFARFVPEAPALSDAGYTALARQVLGRPAWEEPAPLEARLVVPGYADLHALSLAREDAIKAAFDSPVASMAHWRNWRVVLPLPPGHDTGLARQLMEETDAGRPAPLMITNFPARDLLNHAVLVYGYRHDVRVVEFLAYDPNDPDSPLSVYFDPVDARFWLGPVTYGPPGPIRAFRLYGSPLL